MKPLQSETNQRGKTKAAQARSTPNTRPPGRICPKSPRKAMPLLAMGSPLGSEHHGGGHTSHAAVSMGRDHHGGGLSPSTVHRPANVAVTGNAYNFPESLHTEHKHSPKSDSEEFQRKSHLTASSHRISNQTSHQSILPSSINTISDLDSSQESSFPGASSSGTAAIGGEELRFTAENATHDWNQPRLPYSVSTAAIASHNQATVFHNTSKSIHINTNTQGSASQAVLGQTMGYHQPAVNSSSWGPPEVSNSTNSQKMNHHSPHSAANDHTRRKDTTNDDDSMTLRSVDSASIGSPAHGPLLGAPAIMEPATAVAGLQSVATTPTTVSTAPSTNDDISLGALDPSVLEKLSLRTEPLDAQRRGPGWENTSYQSQMYVQDESDTGTFSRTVLPPSQHTTPNAWGNAGVNHQRVASFRNEYGMGGGPSSSSTPAWSQSSPQQPPPSQASQPSRTFGQQHRPTAAAAASNNPAYGTYNNMPQRSLPPAATPPHSSRTPRGGPSNTITHNRPPSSASASTASHSGPSSSSGNPRSPSEVLKTLLRKKACLYEPDTSRAVALATWLVGRVLALEHGYFSRQQLQAGVHACVAGKIDSGLITRTKVNRCMQIILNSCFHYIIPRPDGTEENGDTFRFSFAHEVADDMRLLRELPSPWNDLSVDPAIILGASANDLEGKTKASPGSAPSTPQHSPKLGSLPAERSPKDDHDDSKRAVLLCFNENVRCAEDVFRCHNEFIRDTAHASGLQLSSSEWRSFFGKEAASAPFLWGNIGIPVPHVEGSNEIDALGVMSHSELAKFRTTWCSKRYDHGHDLCGFAHVEINGGWIRRNPAQFNYQPEMCSHVIQIPSRAQGNRMFIVNACPQGVNCQKAHSAEEIMYHAHRYKSSVCSSVSRPGGCSHGDVCPHFHPAESYKFPSKKGDGRLNSRMARQGANIGKTTAPPVGGAPILYCSPAPVSQFEDQFHLPGLKNLYRRHCSVMRAHFRNPGSCVCCYRCFGDDDGTMVDPATLSQPLKRGLPQPRRS